MGHACFNTGSDSGVGCVRETASDFTFLASIASLKDRVLLGGALHFLDLLGSDRGRGRRWSG